MMDIAVDTSAIMAIVLGEDEARVFDAILCANRPFMSVATRVELEVAVTRKLGADATGDLWALLAAYDVRLVPVDIEQCGIAMRAFGTYGKGAGREPALLNFGDTFSFALAAARRMPLLFKGNDFSRTELRSALAELGGRT